MRKKICGLMNWFLTLCVCFCTLTACTLKETAPSDPVAYAENIAPEEVREGDRIVIVGEEAFNAVSKWNRGTGIESAVVRKDPREEKDALIYLSDDTEVFTVENSDRGMVFHGEHGYITVPSGDKKLELTPEIQDGSYWKLSEERKLHASAVNENGELTEYYIGYRTKTDTYGAFDAAEDNIPNTSPFLFYKITDAYDRRDQYEDAYKLKMVHTTDVHGTIFYDDGTDWQLRMARIAGMVNEARSTTGEKRNDTVILLDGGDVFQGSLLSSLLGWQPLSAVFDIMDYDAVALGNHEFDKGLRYVMDSDGTMMDYTRNGVDYVNAIPWVTCNLFQNGEKVEGLREYVILDKTALDSQGEELPVKIGVIGFAEDYKASVDVSNFIDAGYEIMEDYDYAMSLATKLKEEEGCDAVILLCHGDSKNIADNLKEGCDIDLVLGGHLHTFKHGETEYGLKYASNGNKADSLTNADFVFRKKDGKTVLEAVTNVHPAYIYENGEELYDTEENLKTMDRDVYVAGNDYLLLLAEILNIRIGYITTPAMRYEYLPGSRKRSCTAGNWIASIIQRGTESDIAFINSGGLRKDYTIPEGSDRRYINAGDVYEMFTFDDPFVCFEITYEELLTAFNYSNSDGGWGILSRMVGIDCYYDALSEPRVVFALVTYDGEAIYDHGVWMDGWKDKKVTVGMRRFCAENDRVSSDGQHNPFVAWSETDRLIKKDIEAADTALNVLGEEAAANNGHLEIDTKAHFLEMDYVNGQAVEIQRGE